MTELILEKESYQILGACFEVYRELGCGFLEPVYHECLAIEFEIRGIPAQAFIPIPLMYKARPLKKGYIADFVCFDAVVVELKATSGLIDEHRAQTQNYLHATKKRLGLLINFGHFPKIEYERYVV
jgi:GxxExxY protein